MQNEHPEDDFRDIETLFEKRSASQPREINWDDYDFHFDDAPSPPPPPPRMAVSSDRFSVDHMRMVHEGEAVPVRPQPRYQPAQQAAPGRRVKRRRPGRIILRVILILLLLVFLGTAAFFLLGKMPQTDQPIGVRKDGCAAILLCGTDMEGTRTDTMMLLFIDREARQLRLLSLPRDTMVNRTNPVPKLNGAYGANGMGEEGMDVLMDYVKDLVGYRPDGYMLIDLNCFSELVDTMGGVEYDVPMDMRYDDPTQDLHIDLRKGEQSLSGDEAMWLVRFRSGYAMADLERINVQRDFLSSAMRQWTRPSKLFRAPAAIRLVMKNTLTDLSVRNVSWIITSIALCGTDDLVSDTLPGAPATVSGGAYYVEDRAAAAEMVNDRYNPYEREISADELHPYGY